MNREKEMLEAMLAFSDVTKQVPSRHLELVSHHLSVMKLFQAAKKVMTKYCQKSNYKETRGKNRLNNVDPCPQGQDLMNIHHNVMKFYTGSKNAMLKLENSFFKASSRKGKMSTVLFCPLLWLLAWSNHWL